MRRSRALLFICTLWVSLLGGCLGDELQKKLDRALEESAAWRGQVATLQGQLDSIQSAAKEVSANVARGLDNVDPLALKTIFNNYRDLADTNQRLREALAASPRGQTGDIDLGSRRLKVMIERYSGALTLNAFIRSADSTSSSAMQKVWDNLSLNRQTFTLSVPNHADEWLRSCLGNKDCAGDTNWLGTIVWNDHGNSIHALYANDIGTQFARFLETGPYTTPRDQAEVYVEGRLQHAGRHDFIFEAQPQSKVWSVTIVIAMVEANGTTLPVHRVELSDVGGFRRSDPAPIYVRYDRR